MKNKLISMLELQDAMNRKVHPTWREQNFAWYRAIWVECAELMDHYGWKWWKKQQPDHHQVTLELIDIWHFGLSDILANAGDRSFEEVANRVAAAMKQTPDAGDFRETLEKFTATTLSTRHFDIAGFQQLMAATGLTFEQLFRSYVGKNVLNFFRQDHGYKEGTYRKVWQGREDNEHLVEVLETLDSSATDLRERLYGALKARYDQVSTEPA